MQFHLDNETARWFSLRLKPAILSSKPGFYDKIKNAWNGRILDLTPYTDDTEFLASLIMVLLASGSGQIYENEFLSLAKQIGAAHGLSIIDRLAALDHPVPPVEIRRTYATTREIAIEKIRGRLQDGRTDRQAEGGNE